MYKYLLILCSFFCYTQLNAAAIVPDKGLGISLITTPNNAPLIADCNLPAPGNLQLTAVGANFLSFSWNAVAGSAGYDYELRETATNLLVDYGNTDDLFRTSTGLTVNTHYTFRVWSVCQENPTAPKYRSASYSEKGAKTEFVIVDDITPNYQGNATPIVGNDFPIYGAGAYFVAIPKNGSRATFKVEKVPNVGGVNANDYTIYVRYDNTPNPAPGADIWSFGGIDAINNNNNNNDISIPLAGSILGPLSTSNVDIMHHLKLTSQELLPVLILNIYKDAPGVAVLHWSATENLGQAYEIRKLEEISGAKPGNGEAHRQQYGTSDDATPNNIKGGTTTVATADPIQVYPNPFSEVLTIQRNSEQAGLAQVRIFDLNGREILKQVFENETVIMNISTADLSTGMYVVRYETADSVQTIKLFKSN